jgi:hypothetical protein
MLDAQVDVARLIEDHAEQLQGVHLMRVCLENRAVKLLGLREATRLVMLHSLRQGFRNGHPSLTR